MITLNVPDMQTAFDNVALHLASMTHRSSHPEESGCLYFAEDGNRCAVGILIPSLDMIQADGHQNGSGVYSLADSGLEFSTGERIVLRDVDGNIEIDPALEMLQMLQALHDNEDGWTLDGFRGWPQLRLVGERWGMDTSIVDEAKAIQAHRFGIALEVVEMPADVVV